MIKLTIYTLRSIAIFSAIYFIIILSVSGPKTSFLWFWIATLITSFSFSITLTMLFKKQNYAMLRVGTIISIAFWICFAFFFILEGILIYQGHQPAKPNADYAIVLGAQVRGTIPSKTLDKRIKAAAIYLKENPNTIVICSGGQGTGEDITEAIAIKQGLLALGIEEKRIILEENSTNTVENLKFSMESIHETSSDIVIITSNFHCYRAEKIALKLGMNKVTSFGANEFIITTPQYYVREFLAILKDFFFGNL